MKKFISILGSTGSIGRTTLKIINKKKKYFKPYVFSANKNHNLIIKQIKKYKPDFFIIMNYKAFKKIKKKLKKNHKTKILNNFDQIKIKKKSDITVSAIPGLDGLQPTINAIKFSKKILVANKESIICGWDILKKNLFKYKTKIIPIDSEHFSILKLIEKINPNNINKIYITASGGPFLNYKINKLKKIKPQDAFRHPKWKMGKKISVDSATLMNKVFEVLEAQKLFNISCDKISIVVHPESLVHALIELKNGLTYLIYHETSMIIPIANAIFDDDIDIENFLKIKKIKSKSLINNLTFKSVNPKAFPSIKLIREMNKYPSAPIIINASNEILVDQFIMKNLPFLAINKIILTILKDRNYKNYAIRKPSNLNQINIIDKWTRKTTFDRIKSYVS